MAKLTDENRPGLDDSALFEALICLIFVQLSSAEESRYQCVNLLSMRNQPYIRQQQTQDLRGIKQQNQLIYLQLKATEGS